MLDLGSGGQPYRSLFTKSVSYCVAVEKRDVLPPPDVKGDAQSLPFKESAFDTVLCTEVLEHLPEPGLAVAEIGRVRRPGGHLVLTAPHIWGIHEEPHDYYRFTRYGLSHLLERAGLGIIEIPGHGRLLGDGGGPFLLLPGDLWPRPRKAVS